MSAEKSSIVRETPSGTPSWNYDRLTVGVFIFTRRLRKVQKETRTFRALEGSSPEVPVNITLGLSSRPHMEVGRNIFISP